LWRLLFNATTDCCENHFHNNWLYGSTCCGISVSGFDVFCDQLLATTFGCGDRGVFRRLYRVSSNRAFAQSSRIRLVSFVAETLDCPGLHRTGLVGFGAETVDCPGLHRTGLVGFVAETLDCPGLHRTGLVGFGAETVDCQGLHRTGLVGFGAEIVGVPGLLMNTV
jgi:hypothetical protein